MGFDNVNTTRLLRGWQQTQAMARVGTERIARDLQGLTVLLPMQSGQDQARQVGALATVGSAAGALLGAILGKTPRRAAEKVMRSAPGDLAAGMRPVLERTIRRSFPGFLRKGGQGALIGAGAGVAIGLALIVVGRRTMTEPRLESFTPPSAPHPVPDFTPRARVDDAEA